MAEIQSTRSDFYVYALFRENGVPFYIGKGHGRRWEHHERQARNGARSHKCEIIRDMQARGVEVIKTKLHDGLTEDVSHAYEVALIRAIGRGAYGPLVNLTDGGDGVTGFKHPPGRKMSQGHIAKIAAANSGKKRSPEHIAKRSAARRGKKLSAEARANIGAGQRGRKKSPQECANIAAAKRGSKASPEARANMSVAQTGKVLSPETRAKMSAVRRGRSISPEHRASLSAALSGRTISPEWRAKLSAARRAFVERSRRSQSGS